MKKIYPLVAMVILFVLMTGCSRQSFSTTPTPTITLTSTNTSTPAPTNTTTPSNTPSPTPHPLANLPYRILFVSDQDGDADIYSVNADGSDLKNLTNNELDDSYPSASPDGSKIAYASIINGYPNIFIMDSDGRNISQLTNEQNRNEMPNWSPDGKKLAFSSDRTGHMEVFLLNVDGSDLKQLTHDNEMNLFPIWSPDGNWISFSSGVTGNADFFIIHPDGTGVRQITRSPNYDGDAAHWSPDGNWLIFPSERVGNYEVYAYNIETQEFGALTLSAEHDWGAEFSPDGNYLLRDISNGLDQNFITISPVSDLSISYQPSPTKVGAWFSTWLPVGMIQPSEFQVSFARSPDGFCVVNDDPTFGFTLDNPIELGTADQFGGPFASAYPETILRGPKGELVTLGTGSSNPDASAPDAVNIHGDIVAIYQYTIKGIRSGTLYINTEVHTVPRIPTGFSCDLLWP